MNAVRPTPAATVQAGNRWRQPGGRPRSRLPYALVSASLYHLRLRRLVLASVFVPLWECGAFLLRQVPYGDTTPQSLLLWGFGEYYPGLGILVSLADVICLVAGVLRVMDVWGPHPAEDTVQ